MDKVTMDKVCYSLAPIFSNFSLLIFLGHQSDGADF